MQVIYMMIMTFTVNSRELDLRGKTCEGSSYQEFEFSGVRDRVIKSATYREFNLSGVRVIEIRVFGSSSSRQKICGK